jgi:hypothetical protein
MAESSDRMRLARTAVEAALSVDGVEDVYGGLAGVRATWGGGDKVHGVVATAAAGGSVALDLFLVARPVPLGPLAARVRERVARRAAAAGLDGALGPVNIRFEDLAVGERA